MRTKKALYNIISQMIYEIVAMICGLILPRFILSAFGSNYNGMLSSITQFLDYISFLTLGISGSTRLAIYKANASNDIYKVSAILKATEKYMRKVAYVFIGYIILLAFIYPLFVRNEFEWLEASSLVVIIGFGVFAEYFFGLTYKTFLMANQSMYIYNIIQVASKIANTLISLALILLNQEIQIVKLGSAVCFVITPIILNKVVREKYHIINNVEPDYSSLKQRRDVMAHSIANCIHQYTDIFLLTLFTSPSIVSVYAVYNLILSSLRKLQNIFTTGLEAAFGDLWARKEFKKFGINFRIFEFLIFSFVSIVFSCTAILIMPFIENYTKGITDINYLVPVYAYIAVFTEAIYCIRTPYLIAVQAAGKYKDTKKGAFIESGINLIVSLIAVFKFGLIGVILGTLVANIFRTLQYIIYLARNILDIQMKAFFYKCTWCILNIFLINIGHQFVFRNAVISWENWILNAITTVVFAVIIVFISALLFYKTYFLQSIRLVFQMIRRK